MMFVTTELKKLKRNKIIWCILAFTILIEAIVLERTYSVKGASQYLDSFSDLYTVAYKNLSSLFMPIALGMFITTLFFDERKSDTLKQLFTIPISKTKFFFSKVIVMIMLSVIMCLIVFVMCTVGGLVIGIFPEIDTQTLLESALLYLTGGILIPIAMIPIAFLATISKGYILPIATTLIYLFSVYLSTIVGIHPLASTIGVYPYISKAAAEMTKDLLGAIPTISPYVCIASLFLVGAAFSIASIAILNKQSY